MLQLLQPIWLYAIAGIIIPAAIHLWNNKQGKVLAIGSIAFLEKNSRKKARSRQVSEWPLLLLRCLLLILLSLLLAGPFWKRVPGVEEKKGWVLVGKNSINGSGRSRRLLDSLVKAGFEKHVMDGRSWWEGFAALDQEAPAGVPFYVFTDGRLEHFFGERPLTGRPVYWQVDNSHDSAVSWVEDVWQRGSDSVEMITGNSGPTGVSYSSREMGKQDAKTLVDTTTLRVVIYTDEKYKSDGRWVVAAVKALQQFTSRAIEVSVGTSGLGNANWIFWLSSQPPPTDIKTATLFFYEPGRAIQVDTWIKGSDVSVDKVTEQQGQELQPVWVDGFGRPILGREETTRGRRYHFFSHFDPAWNGLVWSTDFPLRMEELLLDRPWRGQDRRVIDPEQVSPSKVVAASALPSNEPAGEEAGLDLAPAAWLLIFLILLAERILSFKRSKNG